jgi:hypothetical protein
MTNTTSIPATDKQLAFIRKLLVERAVTVVTEDHLLKLSKLGASRTIDKLMAMPKVDTTAGPVTTTGPTAPAKVTLDDGLYMLDGEVYKVKRSNGAGRQYASVLVPGADGKGGSFHYAKGVVYRLTPESKMTIEQAKAHGALYGQCACCGRLLSNDESIELGIGPICREKYFG